MKTRKNFVSNSSSSSFIVVGTLIAKGKDILDLKVDDYKQPVAVGRYLSEGVDVFTLTQKHLGVFKRHPDAVDDYTVYDAILYDSDEGSFTKNDLKDNVRYSIVSGTTDQGSSFDAETLEENLLYGED